MPPSISRHRLARATTAALGLVVAALWLAATLALVVPHLGGEQPGLPGWFGFAAETVIALWLPVGVSGAIFAALCAALRRPRAALAVLPIAAIALLPELPWPQRSASAAVNTPRLRIATANLGEQYEATDAMIDWLRALDADVLVLPEFTRAWARCIEPGFVGDYPHRWLGDAKRHDVPYEGFRLAIWSRLPPAGEPEYHHLSGVNSQVRVPLRHGDRTFAVYGIHPRKPFPFGVYRGSFKDRSELLAWLRRETLPCVVAGDFNATPRSAFVARLRALGLSNASETVLGRAPHTWPMDRAYPALVAIDHVMHSDALVATDFRGLPAPPSDHAAVCAELTWR
jgi:endonuclease/exonuclease/phosphatase (EEP) superfamily protein YafD